MSVVGQEPPPFFKRGPAPLARLAFFLALSLLLLVLDLRYHTLEWSRQAVAVVTYPMQRLAYAPAEVAAGVADYFSSLAAAEKKITALRRQQLEDAKLLLRQNALEQENRRLRALLGMKERQTVSGQVAEIIYAARDPFSRRVIIDKGTRAGIAAGQAVVDELGVIGQVTRVFPMLAEVTLITDKDQAVPVQVLRNGLRSVIFGDGNGSLELRFLSSSANIRVGDELVTSGLDGIYLPGLPVARVTRIDRDTTYAFAHIRCEPIAGVEHHGQILVLSRPPAPPPAPPEPQDKPAKGRGEKK
ncbi:cell shape-determining protein MreC [mine drainage metagenome]|uniref:Cell shape-determining protein MreC n=1 Tax=mine drainage metagenome TaxID=410659 RepID=A0A1J5S0K0_9ZZZZ